MNFRRRKGNLVKLLWGGGKTEEHQLKAQDRVLGLEIISGGRVGGVRGNVCCGAVEDERKACEEEAGT